MARVTSAVQSFAIPYSDTGRGVSSSRSGSS